MKLFARFKVVALLVVCALMWAGLAWAGETEVVNAVNAYGLTAAGNGAGTITVTGSVSKPANAVLDLGDITGLNIDWKANLTVTGGSRPGQDVGMINFANGSFKLTGGTIQLPSAADTWIDGIYANGAAIVTMAGGSVKSSRAASNGISVEDGTLIVDGGEINIPKGTMLMAKILRVNDPSGLTGLAGEGSATDYTVTVYGHVTTVPASEVFYDEDEEGDFPGSVSYVVPAGSTWDIDGITSDMTKFPDAAVEFSVESGGVLNVKHETQFKCKGKFDNKGEFNIESGCAWDFVEGGTDNLGTINIYGTLTNKSEFTNGPTGVINNYSGNTLDNRGTFTNKGTINNKSTGKITNTGNIANTGTINNTEGGTFQSVQTKEQMGGTINGDVEPTGGNGNGGDGNGNGDGGNGNGGDGSGGSSSSSSGIAGCNAGFGLIALALAGLAALKHRA